MFLPLCLCFYSNNTGLQGLANQVLGVYLDKSHRVRRSDWEAESLSQEQVVLPVPETNLLSYIAALEKSTAIDHFSGTPLLWTP